MTGLTDKQKQVLWIVAWQLVAHEQTPTVREIGQSLGAQSSCTVQRHLDALEKKGYVTRKRRKQRSLRLTDAGKAAAGLDPHTCPTCRRPLEPVTAREVV